MKTIKLTRKEHRGRVCIFLHFPYDQSFDKMVRSFPGRIWSQTESGWYVVELENSVRDIIMHFKGYFTIDYTALSNNRAVVRSDETAAFTDGAINRPEMGTSDNQEVVITHDERSGLIKIEFEYNEVILRLVRQLEGRWYNPETRDWTAWDNQANISWLSESLDRYGIRYTINSGPALEVNPLAKERKKMNSKIIAVSLSKHSEGELEKLRSYLSRIRYSERTIENYVHQVSRFLRYHKNISAAEIESEHIIEYIEEAIIGLSYSGSLQNIFISSLKKFFQANLGHIPEFPEFRRPNKGRSLPKIFSKEEITRIINATRNPKHRMALLMIYSCGLRRSEMINLRIDDLDFGRKLVILYNAKGKKDRVVPLTEKLILSVDKYLAAYSPVDFFIEGKPGFRYSAESLARILDSSKVRAGIKRKGSLHSLRHSYATHLHEKGIDIRYLQELLGHKSSKTTEIYTHVSRRELSKIGSPLDDLDITE
ncbi:MAG TPA: tyrosine-type recombinase/integrase [Bacteroidales bacterium]|nr:tyrosine-type recombinase/integrase [Bacteroidales bacterium]